MDSGIKWVTIHLMALPFLLIEYSVQLPHNVRCKTAQELRPPRRFHSLESLSFFPVISLRAGLQSTQDTKRETRKLDHPGAAASSSPTAPHCHPF
eukprot:1139485-Pelagomonas_calceolata.AAC.2